MRDDESNPAQTQDITDHPGWFGWGYGGSSGTFILGIHANWPAYPCAPGGLHGLFDLAQFPEGTLFDPIADIDRCVLFIAYKYDPKKPERPNDPFSVDAYQVAIWHEDLLSLQEQGLISGVTPISEREWQLRRRVEFGWRWGRKLHGKDDQRNVTGDDWPALPEAPHPDDMYFGTDPYDYPAFERDGVDSSVTITETGWQLVTQQLASAVELPDDLPDLRKLLDHDLYDSAIREVGIAVEAALREAVGADDGYGQKLVRQFIDHLADDLFAYNTMLKIYRLRLRTFFKFVRNPHAHHKFSVTRSHGLALVASALHLLTDIKEISRKEGGV
ncbi:hypothetical protein [Streptomyces sp. NPDC127066]|uniref:hypothetical protein n=1 Tax=Streptomyces sp. NPDC127066 TaxID=3347125 RepID=UPI00364D00EE